MIYIFFRVFRSLPIYSQHLLVLLIGTFRVIHSNSERAKTGMTAEALGVSVAPSFFHTCVSEGKIAKPEEVQKFKVSTYPLKVWVKKRAHSQKLAISKKSTFSVQSLWNLVKIITLSGYNFDQVSWGKDKKYCFFTIGQFLIVSHFFFTQILMHLVFDINFVN